MEITGPKRIAVFPCKSLSLEFWEELVEALCEVFLNFTVTALGKRDEAYDLEECECFANFENLVGNRVDVINFRQVSVGAVGSVSSLPKQFIVDQNFPFYATENVEDIPKEVDTIIGFLQGKRG